MAALWSLVTIESDIEDAIECPSLPRWELDELVLRLPSKQRLVDTFWVAVNTLATIAVTFLNKRALSDPQLSRCQISFAAFHFLLTFLVLLLSSHPPLRLFPPLRAPLLHILPLSLFFAAFLLLSNASLAHNSIAFYQLAKILTTPALVALSYLLFRRGVPPAQLAAVGAMCVGVGLTTVGELRTNPLGAGLAAAAFSVTAAYQLWIAKKLEELELSPPQLLLNQAGLAAVILAVIAPAVDVMPDLAEVPLEALVALGASGLVASLINLSQFLIIGRTSALTFNIVSMLKMVSILSLGWYVEAKDPSIREMVGVGTAFVGAWFYSRL